MIGISNLISLRNSLRYYKKFIINDMDRINMKLTSKSLTYSHANNTLIIAVCLNSLSTCINK